MQYIISHVQYDMSGEQHVQYDAGGIALRMVILYCEYTIAYCIIQRVKHVKTKNDLTPNCLRQVPLNLS